MGSLEYRKVPKENHDTDTDHFDRLRLNIWLDVPSQISEVYTVLSSELLRSLLRDWASIMKTYAYVSSECCVRVTACLLGEQVGRAAQPVSKHGDYRQWRHGKRATIALVSTGSTSYEQRCAIAVCELFGWDY